MCACIEGLNLFDGIEVDLKNQNGEIVLSHDPIQINKKYVKLKKLFEKNNSGFYALNIKEDGLSHLLKELIITYNVKNYMCFDLSTPEEYQYKKLGLKVFKRFGDLDPDYTTQNNYPGTLFDVFKNQNQLQYIKKLKKYNFPTTALVISPELHRNPYLRTWKLYAQNLPLTNFYLCTDYPQEARDFFNNAK